MQRGDFRLQSCVGAGAVPGAGTIGVDGRWAVGDCGSGTRCQAPRTGSDCMEAGRHR